ncbi:MAG: TetR/AcrR family transcriptional regulator, partial [Alphaproteobacteria bacterium]|nr:TetR/AcrR family transcriptional regulator [Alphaproteobacteria bacterium]MDX5416817.1 TetR/AcrR family transcriptional regulator [Alphaproteobacteria bacterium]MDX5494206.1 TetR/AcrR family transcriptional regulator [Alphaproteobacteria bacterium]
ARAGVTRGALFHHFAGLSALLAATLDEICTSMVVRGREAAAARDPRNLLSGYIDTAWSNFGHPDFKIIIEVWLAARNDPALRGELAPVIQRFRALMSPELNADLAMMVGRSEKNIAFYRLILEAMIGMALGRAVSPDGNPMGHEEAVVGLLKDIASGIEKG